MNVELAEQLRTVGYKGRLRLEDLVEACGSRFSHLIQESLGSWQAYATGQIVYAEAPTPIESLALLYIKLHATDL